MREPQTAPKTAPRIAIIGGGIAGLVAANHIAAAGGRPVVFEATSRLGGRAGTRLRDGFCLNQGPHALYNGGAFHAALRKFGVPFGGKGPDLPRGLALWNGMPHPLPVGTAGRDVPPLDEDDTHALGAFMTQVATTPGLGRGRALADILAALPPRVRTVVEALVRLSTYVHAPTELDAGAALDQLRLSFAGTIYVDGGWGTLVDGMRDAAIASGAAVRSHQRVARVRTGDGVCRVELSDGAAERFAAVILTVPPRTAAGLVAESAQLAAMAANTRPIRLAGLDLALSALPRSGADFALGMDAPTYWSVHSAVADLAPPGGALVHLAHYLAPDTHGTPEDVEALRRMADTLHPGWRDHVVHEQRLSGATVAHDFPRWIDGGRRATSTLEDAPGIFLAGDWIGAQGMLADAAAASARAAADAALDHAATMPVPAN